MSPVFSSDLSKCGIFEQVLMSTHIIFIFYFHFQRHFPFRFWKYFFVFVQHTFLPRPDPARSGRLHREFFSFGTFPPRPDPARSGRLHRVLWCGTRWIFVVHRIFDVQVGTTLWPVLGCIERSFDTAFSAESNQFAAPEFNFPHCVALCLWCWNVRHDNLHFPFAFAVLYLVWCSVQVSPWGATSGESR